MMGTQISEMPNKTSLVSGDIVPIVSGASNYSFDLGAEVVANQAFIETIGSVDGAANTGTADGTNVQANLDHGGWVTQDGTGAQQLTTATQVKAIAILPQQFGAKFDGATDDSAGLQATSESASSYGRPVLLPGATALVDTPIDLVGLNVDIRGLANKTRLDANSATASIFNIEEPSDVSYYPLRLSKANINGNSLLTNAAISLRYRHNYVISDMLISNAPRGIRIKDGNNGTLFNIRTSAVTYGLHSEGSNHASAMISCSFGNASGAGVLMEANGTAADGNFANAFYSLTVQDGTGNAFEANYGTSSDLFTPYMGETTTGSVINNKGGSVNVNGGILFFDGGSSNYLVNPIGSGTSGQGGVTRIARTRIAASGASGLAKLSGLTSGQVDTAKNGKFKLEDVDLFCTVAGGGLFYGDVVDCAPTTNGWVPRNGRAWTPDSNGSSGATTSGNSQTVTSSGASLIGFYTTINSNLWRTDGPLFFIMCYTASKAVVVATMTAPQAGGGDVLGVAPASTVPATWVACEVTPTVFSGIDTLQLYTNGNAVSGDAFTLIRAGLADADFVNSGGRSGVLCNLFYP